MRFILENILSRIKIDGSRKKGTKGVSYHRKG